MESANSPLFSPARLGPIELKNRFIKAATFEGMTRDGLPGEKLTAFHRRLAEGGIAMTTLAYCATEADGRLHDKMMYLHRGIEGDRRADPPRHPLRRHRRRHRLGRSLGRHAMTAPVICHAKRVLRIVLAFLPAL